MRILVVGGGIAGVSAAAHLGEGGAAVVLAEAESTLAYHTTGRSAATFVPGYGGPCVRPLSDASWPVLNDPPDSPDGPLLSPLGCVMVAESDQEAEFELLMAEMPTLERIDAARALELVPILTVDRLAFFAQDSNVTSIDVAGLHQMYVRMARRARVDVRVSAPLTKLGRTANSWRASIGAETVEIDVVVNAAGAWGDVVAGMAGVAPLGLQPLRRTIFMVPAPADPAGTAMVLDASERFYFKRDGAQFLCSPAEETPSEPVDARPEELDIAIAIERINAVTSLAVRTVNSSWTGLRTFCPDRIPTIGFDDTPGFFWVVGQGGFGIQTAPAIGRLIADLIFKREPQVDETPFRPQRLRLGRIGRHRRV